MYRDPGKGTVSLDFSDPIRRSWCAGGKVGTFSRRGVFTCMYGVFVGLGGMRFWCQCGLRICGFSGMLGSLEDFISLLYSYAFLMWRLVHGFVMYAVQTVVLGRIDVSSSLKYLLWEWL